MTSARTRAAGRGSSRSSRVFRAAGAGLEVVDHFTLPREAWTLYFYGPMKARLGEFRRAWSGDEVGLAVISELDAEIDMYERWSHVQGYEFFVARRPVR